MKTRIRQLKLGILIAIGISAAMSGMCEGRYKVCEPSTSPGGKGCISESDGTCKNEGLACGWTITVYSCDWVNGIGDNQCQEDSDCSGGGTSDTAWCYTCAGGCCCTAN
jgi:hypothetical protein